MADTTKPKKADSKDFIEEANSANVEVYNHQDNLLELERMLETMRDFVNNNKNPQWAGVRIRMNRHIEQDLQFLSLQTGNVTNISRYHSDNGSGNPLLENEGKVHKIMGVSLEPRNKFVTEDVIKPTIKESTDFGEKVDSLMESFFSLKDRDLDVVAQEPEGSTVIRGLAKKLGIVDWESVDIDATLYADVRDKIRENKQNQEQA